MSELVPARPWSLRVARTMAHVHKADGFIGLTLPYHHQYQQQLAAFILRACNAHDDLLAAADRAIAALAANGAPNCEAAKELRAAIAKARGQS